jgi:hypothetical protein
MDIDVTMWISCSEDDSGPDDFEDFNGEEYQPKPVLRCS